MTAQDSGPRSPLVKPKSDEWEDEDEEQVCLGIGSLYDLNGRRSKKKPRPIGFVVFPDKPRRRAKKAKRRKK